LTTFTSTLVDGWDARVSAGETTAHRPVVDRTQEPPVAIGLLSGGVLFIATGAEDNGNKRCIPIPSWKSAFHNDLDVF